MWVNGDSSHCLFTRAQTEWQLSPASPSSQYRFPLPSVGPDAPQPSELNASPIESGGGEGDGGGNGGGNDGGGANGGDRGGGGGDDGKGGGTSGGNCGGSGGSCGGAGGDGGSGAHAQKRRVSSWPPIGLADAQLNGVSDEPSYTQCPSGLVYHCGADSSPVVCQTSGQCAPKCAAIASVHAAV